jgi:DNA invertase Pin-like site-specific DNA recombinase
MILGYVRVSTVEQGADDRTSLQTQENVIRGYALAQGADKFGVQIYSDVGESGATPLRDREAGRALLADAQSGDVVIASKLDRLFRSAKDALITAEEWQERGVKLVLYDMGTTPVMESVTAKLFFQMLTAMAEFERGRIAERMITGKLAKKANGGHAGGRAPWGMKIVGSGRAAKLEPNPDEQAIAEFVRAKYDQYGDVGAVTKFVNKEGYRTRTGQPFQFTQVKRILDRHID